MQWDQARNKMSTRLSLPTTYNSLPLADSLILQIKLILYNSLHLCKLKRTNRNETEQTEAKNYLLYVTAMT